MSSHLHRRARSVRMAAAPLVLFLGLPVVLRLSEAQQPPRTLDLRMYLEWEDVASPQLSPDGTRVLYERHWVDRMNDRMDASMWMMAADGSPEIPGE